MKVKSTELAIKLDLGYEIKRNLKDKIFDPKTEKTQLLLVDWEEYGRNRLQESTRIATNSCAFHICTTDGQIKILKARTNYYFATMIITLIRAVHKHSTFLSKYLVVLHFPIQFKVRCRQVTSSSQ